MAGERYTRYKDSISRAKQNYMQKKRQVILVLDPEEHESIKSYCEAKGMSMNSFIRECVLEKMNNG